MSFCLLSYQSACVSSIWCRACWLFLYYLSTHFYHEMALHVAAITKPTINMLDNGDAVPCPFPWSSGVEPAPALVLLVWMVHCSFLRMSQSICVGWADDCKLGCSLDPGIIQGKVTVLNPFGGLCKSTLDDFLKSDRDYLQLPRLLL